MLLLARRFAVLSLGLFVSAGALAPAPAHAGRASACKAPPFAVPKDTQRAVDAAIDAHVTGTGTAGVSSTVQTRTDYETVTLSQDAAARAWTEYSLCAKLAKKLISQELHDELLRSLLLPQASASGTSAVVQGPSAPLTADPGTAPPTAPPSVDKVVGTWQVTTRFVSGSCPEAMLGGASAFTWLISEEPSGAMVVQSQGQTNYPELRGTWQDGRMRISATVNQGGAPSPRVLGTTAEGWQIAMLPRTDFDLRLEGDELIGTRDIATWGSTLSSEAKTYTVLPCTLRYEVHGTR